MEGLWKRSAAEIAGLVKSRQVSAVEVTQSAFSRLQAINGKLNAVVIETPEDALRSAEMVDQAIDRVKIQANWLVCLLRLKSTLTKQDTQTRMV